MKKRRFSALIFLVVITLVLSFATSTYAAPNVATPSLSDASDPRSFTISGKTTDASAEVTMCVFKAEDENSISASTLKYIWQDTSNSSKDFSINFALKESDPNGTYYVRVGDSSGVTAQASFVYSGNVYVSPTPGGLGVFELTNSVANYGISKNNAAWYDLAPKYNGVAVTSGITWSITTDGATNLEAVKPWDVMISDSGWMRVEGYSTMGTEVKNKIASGSLDVVIKGTCNGVTATKNIKLTAPAVLDSSLGLVVKQGSTDVSGGTITSGATPVTLTTKLASTSYKLNISQQYWYSFNSGSFIKFTEPKILGESGTNPFNWNAANFQDGSYKLVTRVTNNDSFDTLDKLWQDEKNTTVTLSQGKNSGVYDATDIAVTKTTVNSINFNKVSNTYTISVTVPSITPAPDCKVMVQNMANSSIVTIPLTSYSGSWTPVKDGKYAITAFLKATTDTDYQFSKTIYIDVLPADPAVNPYAAVLSPKNTAIGTGILSVDAKKPTGVSYEADFEYAFAIQRNGSTSVTVQNYSSAATFNFATLDGNGELKVGDKYAVYVRNKYSGYRNYAVYTYNGGTAN